MTSSLNIFPVYYSLTATQPTNQNINYGRRFTLVNFSFLSAFAKFIMSVRLSVRMEQLGSHWTDFFYEI